MIHCVSYFSVFFFIDQINADIFSCICKFQSFLHAHEHKNIIISIGSDRIFCHHRRTNNTPLLRITCSRIYDVCNTATIALIKVSLISGSSNSSLFQINRLLDDGGKHIFCRGFNAHRHLLAIRFSAFHPDLPTQFNKVSGYTFFLQVF